MQPHPATKKTHGYVRGAAFFWEIVFQPKSADLVFHLGHAGTLYRCQGLLRHGIALLPLIYPVVDRALVDRQITRDLGNRAARLDDELHRLCLELRRELPSMLRHRPSLLSGENLSKILDTPHSVPDPIASIEIYLHVNNEHPKPLAWTATADSILTKVQRRRAALQQVNRAL